MDLPAFVVYDSTIWLPMSKVTAWLLWIQHIDKAVHGTQMDGTDGGQYACIIGLTNDCGPQNI
jgi:hypothetical protein